MRDEDKYKVLILGASYGSLLASKLLLAGHDVKLVCLPEEAEIINREGIRVRIPVKGLEAPVELVQPRLGQPAEPDEPQRLRRRKNRRTRLKVDRVRDEPDGLARDAGEGLQQGGRRAGDQVGAASKLDLQLAGQCVRREMQRVAGVIDDARRRAHQRAHGVGEGGVLLDLAGPDLEQHENIIGRQVGCVPGHPGQAAQHGAMLPSDDAQRKQATDAHTGA